MNRRMLFLCLAGFILFLTNEARCCTTMLVTRGASADGSLIVAHSEDDHLGDNRVVFVPARDYARGARRPVYYDDVALSMTRNRYVGRARGPEYNLPGFKKSKPLGFIPQVRHTYAYYDGNYGLMNEHQLMIGECTDAGKIQLDAEPGKRIFYSSELSRVALERCTSAREAVKLMGSLIDEYGYYGTGETLLVGDPHEGWVMEMACGTLDGKGGLWVAKRVPEGEVFVAANEFRIRDVDPRDSDMMYSANLFAVSLARGWWHPDSGPLDWLRAVSPGEFHHPYYALRRVWRLVDRLCPSVGYSPWVEDGYTRAYPFSVRPEKPLAVADVFSLYRDVYDNTRFDMRRGPAAGPFGTPVRWIGPSDGVLDAIESGDTRVAAAPGAWERPVSIFYCGYTQVCQGRAGVPDPVGGVCWLGLDKPYLTTFLPFHVIDGSLPLAWQTGSTGKFDRGTAWWAFNFVANWANLRFDSMAVDIIARRQEIESRVAVSFAAADQKAQASWRRNPAAAKQLLARAEHAEAARALAEWWDLADLLVVKYSDGYLNLPEPAQHIGYPDWWLRGAGYGDGPTDYRSR